MKRGLGLARGLLLLYLAEVTAKLLGFATFAYLGRKLGPGAYGDLEFAVGVAFILTLLLEAGLGPYAARRVSIDPDEAPGLVPRLCAFRLLLLLVALPLVLLAGLFLPRPEARNLAWLGAFCLLPAPLLLPWIFQARGEMGVVGASSLLRQAAQAALVFLFVSSAAGAAYALVGDALGLALAGALHLVLARKRIGPLPWREAFSGLGAILRESLPFAASTLAWALRWFSPLLALGFADAGAATGHFGSGHRLVVAAHAFVWLWFFNLLPTLARAAQSDRDAYLALQTRSLRIAGWLACAGAGAATILGGPVLVLLFGAEFEQAAPAFRVLVWALFFALLSGHWRFGLLATGRARHDLVANAAGAAVAVGGATAAALHANPLWAAGALVAGEITTAGVAVVLHPELAIRPALAGIVRPLGSAALAGLAALLVPAGVPALVTAIVFLAVLATGFFILGRGELRRGGASLSSDAGTPQKGAGDAGSVLPRL